VLTSGARIGPYEIVGALGAGGMGQVYKARDTRLDRLVAIKQSATEFSDRFEREARAVAALNHPSICQLYDVGPDYLVMEFVEGQALAPVEGTRKLLDLAVQIADGIAAAHAAGIVHRDLKPDNILVTADGRVKILDFGIAKAIAGDAGEQHTPASLTGAGTAIGTVHYMSPEQARGLATIGPQSDQFSFGLILYELVTGQKPFARDSSAETLTAIIREDAAPLPASVPAPVRWIIERLLAKDPAERYDSSRDLYRELKQLRDRLSHAAAPISGVTAAVSAAPVPASRTRRWSALVAAMAHGRSLAYTATVDGVPQLMVREIGGTAVQLTRATFPAASPFWAPDGSRVFFLSGPAPALWSVSAVGGEPEKVIDGATSAAVHPRDGRFVFARAGSLWLANPSSGAAPQPFGQAPFTDPSPSPGAMAVFVEEFSPDGTKIAVVKAGSLWLLTYPEGESRQLSNADLLTSGFSSWMPDSRHYITEKAHDRGLVGFAIVVVDSETQTSRAIFTSPAMIVRSSVSPDGTRLAFASGDLREKVVEMRIADGRVRALESGSHLSRFPSLSPDGTRLAVSGVAGDVTGTIREMTLSATGAVVSKTITVMDEGQMIEHVQWSPDGARPAMATVCGRRGFRHTARRDDRRLPHERGQRVGAQPQPRRHATVHVDLGATVRHLDARRVPVDTADEPRSRHAPDRYGFLAGTGANSYVPPSAISERNNRPSLIRYERTLVHCLAI
jgi:Tol biopolymer transport system component/predicted Ser/Thr protein kinase